MSKEVKTLKDPYVDGEEEEDGDWGDAYWSFLDQALALKFLNGEGRIIS